MLEFVPNQLVRYSTEKQMNEVLKSELKFVILHFIGKDLVKKIKFIYKLFV